MQHPSEDAEGAHGWKCIPAWALLPRVWSIQRQVCKITQRDLNEDVKKCEVKEMTGISEAHVSLFLPEPTHPDDRRVRVTPHSGLSSGCMARPSVSW